MKPCLECGQPISPTKRKTAKFCSPSHASANYERRRERPAHDPRTRGLAAARSKRYRENHVELIKSWHQAWNKRRDAGRHRAEALAYYYAHRAQVLARRRAKRREALRLAFGGAVA